MAVVIKTDVEHLWELAEKMDGRALANVRMTEEEFVAWCPEEVRAEWVNGEVFLMAPGNFDHEDINEWLITITKTFVAKHDLGNVKGCNFYLKLSNELRLPDLAFVAKERLHLFKRSRFEGAPDLIMEVISPDSRNRDRREKFLKYEEEGVREYWIIDPLLETIDLYSLVNGKFEEVDAVGGKYSSKVLPGYFIKLEWLMGGKPTDPLAIFRELGLM